jgi:RNA polymerase sigma-70 factor (ECF subfamily)
VTGYSLAAGQLPGSSLLSREVLAARVALAEGLQALRETIAEIRRMPSSELNTMRSLGVRGDGGNSRTRNRPHGNDAPTRHLPTGNVKPVGAPGRPASPGRQPTPVDSPEHISAGPTSIVIDPPDLDEVADPGTGSGFPSRPEPGDQAFEVWQLVERAQNGEVEAFGLIYDRYMDTVFRFIYFRVGNRQLAEDLTSDTFLRALKRIGSFTWQGRDLGAWLVTIARNLVADHFKSGRYRLEVTTGDVLDADREDRGPEGSPESAVVDHITNVTLLTAVKQLNPEQQECIVLRFLQGFSVAETAQAMSKNEGAIKALQYRAVRALARLLPDGFQQ